MTDLLHDLRYAVRILFKNPVFTAAAVLTLALGIGLNAAVFSIVHGTLLKPLPGVEKPDELVQIYRSWPGLEYGSLSIPHFIDVRERNSAFSEVAAFNVMPISRATSEGGSEMALGSLVSANYFQTLGVQAAMGRTFRRDEDVGPGAHPVVVMGHSTWATQFGADPAIIGRTVSLNGFSYEVVGVAPEGFRGTLPIIDPGFWIPMMMQEQAMPNSPNQIEARGSSFMLGVARLRPGVTIDQARANMDVVLSGLREAYPDSYEDETSRLVLQSEAGLAPEFRGAQVGLSTVIMVVVALLLLIACVNVANLFLARARERQQEMGIRLSLGAARGRIVRQLLTESMVFAAVSGAAGIGLAYLAIGAANRVQLPSPFPIVFDFAMDAPVLAFAVGVSLFTGLVFGLVPALQASRPETVTALKGAARGRAGSRASNALVVVQMAMSLVLLIGAGLFLENMRGALAIDKGFESDNLVIAAVDPSLIGYDQVRTEEFYSQLVERVTALPGVRSMGLGQSVPLGFQSQQRGVSVPGYEPGPDERMSIDFNIVAPGYFEAMGVQLKEGRVFDLRDDEAGAPVLIINQALADRFFPGESAVGRVISTAGEEREVIGVTETGKYGTLGEAPLGYMYLSHPQVFRADMMIHVRTAGDPTAMVPLLRSTIERLDPEMPLFSLQTMDAHLGLTLLPSRLAGLTLGAFGILGLILAAVGIYGVMAYSVVQRKREISIRVALGADRATVSAMVVKKGMKLAGLGVAVGLVLSFGTATLVKSLLYTGNAIDLPTFTLVPLALALVAFLATYVPARRAARMEPMRILRTE
jgi:putative ABC transport system permease protein